MLLRMSFSQKLPSYGFALVVLPFEVLGVPVAAALVIPEYVELLVDWLRPVRAVPRPDKRVLGELPLLGICRFPYC